MNHLNDIKALADLVMGEKPKCNQKDKPVEEDEYLKDFDQKKEDAMTLKWLNEGD